jgi:hypothetical protein
MGVEVLNVKGGQGHPPEHSRAEVICRIVGNAMEWWNIEGAVG